MQSDNRKRDAAGSFNDTSLTKLLYLADLSSYEIRLRGDLKLRNAEDLQYVEEVDLSGIGMSRPEQKRLRKEYDKMYPKGVVGKLKKVFGKSDTEKKDNNLVEMEEDQHIIALEKITLCKELGRGEFGSVWNASWKSNNSGDILQVAVKCVDPDKLIATSSSFLQEASIMTKMRHDNIVRLYGVVLDTKRVMMVSELATCGSLLECLHKPALKDSFPIHVLCDYAEQICKGMAYLESKKLIHRDLASRNVLVFSPKKVKISDFGLSRSLGIGEDYYRTEFSPNLRLPIAWCAPECINYLKFTSASDVWAYSITLFEMFSYGLMPWAGMNGAEILDAIDRQRRVLPQPECCPEDIYEMMKECWSHNPRQRPTFAELVVQFPEKQPQTVRAVCDIKDAAADHLSFKKDDLITVIQKTPSAYPDGYYWFGSLRNGRTGLFRPADTVAHLGAENPSDYIGNSCVPNENKKEKKNSKKSKEEERERKKALISEPVGDLRHTCHVGIDGYAFGLLQLDKKEMTVPVASPEGRRSLGNKSQSSLSATSSSVPLRSDLGREGVPFRDTMSLRDPSGAVSPSTSRHQPVKPMRTSLQPSAPPLTSSAESTMNKNMHDVFEELNSSLRSLEMSASSTTPLLQENNSQRSDFKRPQPICAVYARSPTNGLRSAPNASDTVLTAEVEHLERDLTEFSLSSMSERPLLEKKKSEKTLLSSRVIRTGSSLRSMTSDEYEKWQSKQSREHKKAEHLLSEEKRSYASSSEELDKSLMSTLKENQNEPVEWSPEAQEAYKLLVECGTTLQQTSSPSPSRVSTIDKKEKRVTIIENKTMSPPPRPVTPPHEESVTSYTPQKRIHIIETKLLSGPADDIRMNESSAPNLPPKGAIVIKPPTLPPKVRQVPIAVDGRMNYDNLNGFGAGKNPPPVPPKPKVNIQRPSTSSPPNTVAEEKYSPGIAEAITRTALFASQNKEEIVKF